MKIIIFMKQLQFICLSFFLFTLTTSFFLRSNEPSQNLLFFNDGSKYLKTVNQNIQIWNHQPNHLLRTIQNKQPILHINLHPVDNRIFILFRNGLRVQHFQLSEATFGNINWQGLVKSAIWEQDNQHLIVIGTTTDDEYFSQTVDISDLTTKRSILANRSNGQKKSFHSLCVTNQLLFIWEDGLKVKVFDMSENKMVLVKELENVVHGQCGKEGFYSLGKKGRTIKKYNNYLEVVKEKVFSKSILNIQVKQSGIVILLENQLNIVDFDLNPIQSIPMGLPAKRFAPIESQQLIALEFANSEPKIISIVAYTQRILQFQVGNNTNDTNGTGLDEIVQPDGNFIIAMVVSFGLIIIIFVVMFICFAINKDELSGKESYIQKEMNMKAGQ